MLSNQQKFEVPKTIRDIKGTEYNAVGSFDIYGAVSHEVRRRGQ